MPAAAPNDPRSKTAFPGSRGLAALALSLVLLAIAPSAGQAEAVRSWGDGTAVVGYTTAGALRGALAASGARVLRQLPELRVAVVRLPPQMSKSVSLLREAAGIGYVARPVARHSLVEPALAAAPVPGGAYEWQYAVAHLDQLPAAALAAASPITIAVIDSGADLSAPDLAAKSPATWSVLSGTTDVTDFFGHGTYVSSLAAGSPTNGEGIAGFGGAAHLLVIQAGNEFFTDVDIAAAITYAVDHGAKIINLSLGGPDRSFTETRAIDYAVSRGVLLVAAAGNSGGDTNAPDYPAAELQPLGTNGAGGAGLAVAASTLGGVRASFSNFGSYISLAAPGENVFGAISAAADPALWPATPLPGSSAGLYGYSSGTSFSAPEVAGIAALVWGQDPNLHASDVAGILKQTASGQGTWTPGLGFGVVNAQAAVALAAAHQPLAPPVSLSGTRTGSHLVLEWSAPRALAYRLSVSKDGGSPQLLYGATLATSAAYDLEPGHNYSFTVETSDFFGYHGVSQPYTVSLHQAPATLTLAGTSQHRGPRLFVQLSLRLYSGEAGVSTAARPLLLESFDGSSWRVFDHLTTAANGSASSTFTVRRGRYEVRARFAGSDQLTSATSSTLSFRAG